MPVQLPPLSRRDFITRTLLGTSGLLVGQELLVQAKQADPHTWALLSDTHIAGDTKLVAREVNMAEHLERAVQEVLTLEPAAAGVLVCGDCAYSSGQGEDYRTFTKLLEPLREQQLPITLTLGNHDNREHFREVIKPVAQSTATGVADHITALVSCERANWFILDSLDTTNLTPGLLGEEQLKWLAGSLDANKSKPAIVMVHHNPGIDGHMGLKDTVALFEVIRPRSHVKAYVFGHTHKWKLEEDTSGLHLVNLPAVGYVFDQKEPSGWIQAHLEADAVGLEFHAMDRSHRAHGERHTLKWRKS